MRLALSLRFAGVHAHRVARDEVALLRDGQDLPEARDRLVDRLRRERLLAHLEGAVAVDLSDGDLRQVVAVEEGQEVVAELPRVVGEGVRTQLAAPRLEPLGGELVERRAGWRLHRGAGTRRPQSSLHIGEDVAQLGLGLRSRPAVCGAAERDELPAAVRPETEREHSAPSLVALDHLACRSAWHRLFLVEPTLPRPLDRQERHVGLWRNGGPSRRNSPRRSNEALRDHGGIESQPRTRSVAKPNHAQHLRVRVHPAALHVEARGDLSGSEHPAVAIAAEQRGDFVGDLEDRRAVESRFAGYGRVSAPGRSPGRGIARACARA